MFPLRCSKKGSCSAIEQRQLIFMHDYSWIDQSIFQNLWKNFKKKEEKFLENSVTLSQKMYEAGIELRKSFMPHKRGLKWKYWAEQPVSGPNW